MRYEVKVSSLPYPLQRALEDRLKADQVILRPSHGDKARALSNLRYNIIEPALQYPKNSNERGGEITKILTERHFDLDGRPLNLAARTLHSWIADYERTGTIAGLRRTKRIDAGDRRFVLSRAWDSAVPFDEVTKLRIFTDTLNMVRGYIAEGLARSKIKVLAGEYLVNTTRAHGYRPNDPDALAHVCRIPDRLIQENRKYKRVYDLKYNAKRAHDTKPRIRRTIGDLEPMECVVLDVHKINVLVPRSDGKAVTPYLLGFIDAATRRCWCELILVEGRGAVRNTDQIAAFMAMAMHPAFGLPKTIYVDNGSEYLFADFLDAAMKLGVGVEQVGRKRKSNVVRAKAYNAAAKVIEAWFGHLEQQFLKHLPGWIDDDRMNAQSPTLGKQIKPFEGGFDGFRSAFFGLLKSYEHFPQQGEFKGKSPSQMLKAHVDNGWQAIIIDPKDFLTAFTKPRTVAVRQGTFRFDNRHWTCDELLRSADPQAVAHIPQFGLQFNELRVDDCQGNPIGFASADRVYEYLDPRGARESARRSHVWRTALNAMRKGIPQIDVAKELIAYGENALPVHPNEPSGVVSINDYRPAPAIVLPEGESGSAPSTLSDAEREARHQDLAKSGHRSLTRQQRTGENP